MKDQTNLNNTNNNYESFKEKSYNMNSSNTVNPFSKVMASDNQKSISVEKEVTTPNWYINLKNKSTNSKLKN